MDFIGKATMDEYLGLESPKKERYGVSYDKGKGKDV